MRRTLDVLSQSLKGMFRNGLLTFVSIFVLTSCLLFIGSFALIALNINYNLDDVSELNEIEVFLDYDADEETVARVGREIASLDNIASVEYMSKQDALDDMEVAFTEYAYLFSDITDEENPLSDTYKIIYEDNSKVTTLDYDLKQIDGVRKVNSRLDLAATIDAIRSGISLIFIWFTVLCGVVCVFVFMNTIKISVYTRREEITIMRYIGASRTYIGMPFVFEGIFIGAIGATIAFFLEKLIYSALSNYVSNSMYIVKLYTYSQTSGELLAIFFGISIISGIIGSCASLGKYVEA